MCSMLALHAAKSEALCSGPSGRNRNAACGSWVRAADAPLDPVLYEVVADWLARSWPFAKVDYAVRPGT